MVRHMKDLRPMDKHLLLLGGAGEARQIAEALTDPEGIRVTASLLYPSRAYGDLPIPSRYGGFGGDEGFAAYLDEHNVTGVLDVTHPFSTRIAARTARICTARKLPHARVLRREWSPGPGDNWQFAKDESAASSLLQPGQRVFATTGQTSLPDLVRQSFAEFKVRKLTNAPPLREFRNVEFILARGPFSVAQEIETFRALSIDVLVAKNNGGAVSRTKLDAARALGLPVILIDRPPQPDVQLLPDVATAMRWIAAL